MRRGAHEFFAPLFLESSIVGDDRRLSIEAIDGIGIREYSSDRDEAQDHRAQRSKGAMKPKPHRMKNGISIRRLVVVMGSCAEEPYPPPSHPCHRLRTFSLTARTLRCVSPLIRSAS